MAKTGAAGRSLTKKRAAKVSRRGGPTTKPRIGAGTLKKVSSAIVATTAGPVKYLKVVNSCAFPIDVAVSKNLLATLWQPLTPSIPASPNESTWDLSIYPLIPSGMRKLSVKRGNAGAPTTTARAANDFNYSKTATSGTAVYHVSYASGSWKIDGPTYQ